MHNFTVFVDEVTDTYTAEPPSYMIALAPSSWGGAAMGTKHYSTKESLAHDLQQRLRYTAGAVERFFASEDRHRTPHTDESPAQRRGCSLSRLVM